MCENFVTEMIYKVVRGSGVEKLACACAIIAYSIIIKRTGLSFSELHCFCCKSM